MNVIKRNGVEVPFDKSKISGAIGKAMRSVYNDADEVMAESIADAVSAKIAEFQRPVGGDPGHGGDCPDAEASRCGQGVHNL